MIDVEDFEITFVLALMPLQELEMWIEPFLVVTVLGWAVILQDNLLSHYVKQNEPGTKRDLNRL